MKRYKPLREYSSLPRKVHVPHFKTEEDAIDFILHLKQKDIVIDPVINPENNDELLAAGDSKQDFDFNEYKDLVSNRKKPFIYQKGQDPKDLEDFYKFKLETIDKNIKEKFPTEVTRKDGARLSDQDIENMDNYEYILQKELDKVEHKNTEIKSAEVTFLNYKGDKDKVGRFGYEIKWSPEVEFDMDDEKLQKVFAQFAPEWRDYLHDNPGADKSDVESWMGDASADIANDVSRYPHHYGKDVENAINYLKATHVTDIQGRVGEEIFDAGYKDYHKNKK